MTRDEQRAAAISRDEAREYILDILQELAQLARAGGDDLAEESLTLCWQTIWRTDKP